MQLFKCKECGRTIDAVIPMKRPLPVPHFYFTGTYESPGEKISINRRRDCRGGWEPVGTQREVGLDEPTT